MKIKIILCSKMQKGSSCCNQSDTISPENNHSLENLISTRNLPVCLNDYVLGMP